MNGAIRTAYAADRNPGTAIHLCREQLQLEAFDLLLVFIGGKHNTVVVLEELKEVFGEVPFVGGSAAGVIASTGYGYTGFEVGIMGFKGAAVTPRIVSNRDLLLDETAAGEKLGQAVHAQSQDGAAVLLLFDSVAETVPLRLHPASRIMDGFQKGLGDRRVQVIGGGLLTDINISDGWVFDHGEVCKHVVTALIFPAEMRATTVILHGCRPVSTFMDITRIEGAEVLELNGEAALTVVERMLGLELGTTSGQELSLVATLGEKHGDPFAPYDENSYVNRLILHANPVRGSITLFEPDFAEGASVQIMSRDNGLMLESAERGVGRLLETIRGQKNALALYIDCAGRASVMSGAEVEEAEVVMHALAPDYPFMGFYSGVEIAPLGGDYSRPLDWTGVLTVFQTDG